MSSNLMMWMGVSSALNLLLHVGLALGLLTVVLIFVRTGRRDAFPLALTGALLELVTALSGGLAAVLGTVAASQLGVERYAMVTSVVSLVFGLIGAVGRGCILGALVVLSRPPRAGP